MFDGAERIPPRGEEPLPPSELPELPETDGEPLESPFHREADGALIDTIESLNLGGFVGGNLFVYYDQSDKNKRVGPDFFFVRGADPDKPREVWAVWQEDGQYPHVIIELLSPSTANKDRGSKKDFYESVFTTTEEYFIFDRFKGEFHGWRRSPATKRFEPIPANKQGRFASEVLQLDLGAWYGQLNRLYADWPRFFYPNGDLVLHPTELERRAKELAEQRADLNEQQKDAALKQAEAALKKAESERQQKEAAQAEVARLQKMLGSRPTG